MSTSHQSRRPKRILVLNYEFPPLGGGASPVSYELAKRLSETGEYDIDVVTMRYKGLPAYEKLNGHLRVHRVWCLRSKKEMCHPWEQASYLVSAYVKCRELLRQKSYDVCHAHFIIPTGVLARRLKKEFGLPYVITAHGSDVPGFNSDRFKLLHAFTGPSLRNIAGDARLIVSPSGYLKGLMLKRISPDLGKKIAVIPNGIDTARFSPQAKKNRIFSSGRLLPRKGFQHLIRAVSGEDLGWEVHIAGDGPMREELQNLARTSKTAIVFHGWLDNREAVYKDLLEQAGIYVLASEKENASIALLEAMSAGCAVITTSASGTAETVGESGLLVGHARVDELRLAIESMVRDAGRLAYHQQAARLMTERVYAYPLIVDQYDHVLV